MNLPMVCNSPTRLLLFMLTWVCAFYGSAKKNHRDSPFGYWNTVTKCSDSACFGKTTTFYTYPFGCYCDEACYKIFSDCCPDYETKCGRQEFVAQKPSAWQCIKHDFLNWKFTAYGVIGVWMISKCPANWGYDELRRKCENAPSKFSYPLEETIPVVVAKGETYRNWYCALCNGVKNYTAWDFNVSTEPPSELDMDSQLKSVLSNGGKIWYIGPKRYQPWRLCYGRNFVDNCNLRNNPSWKACVKGPVEVVVDENKNTVFKNSACATCHGSHNITSYRMFLSFVLKTATMSFSIVYTPTKVSVPTEITSYCSTGTVYDPTGRFCRDELRHPDHLSVKQTNEFLILLWFKQLRGRNVISSRPENNDLESALLNQFYLRPNQISGISSYRQTYDLFVSKFFLTLTPSQNLILAKSEGSNLNLTHENTAFLELLNFTKNFTLFGKENIFSVKRVFSKRLCYDRVKLQPDEYKTYENGSLVVNKTGKTFSLENYTVVKEEDGSIILCRKLVVSDCPQGACVLLNQSEYLVFPNLTVYHNATGNAFDFGEYLLTENKGTNNKPNATQISPFPSDLTIAVCLPFKINCTKTKTIHITKETSYALKILTSVGFSVSIICLMLLMITYGLFRELRTVPGMNLMNLSSSMLLSHLLWLIGTGHFTGTTACKGFAIVEHYLFQVSFLAMSVISYHSCYVFSQPFAGRVANNSYRRFIKYSAFVWLTPAAFVAICVALDETETFLVDYGTNCWMGNVDAKLYLFLLPLAVILLYNIVTFIRTAVSLHRHDKNREVLQRNQRKQNLLICTKLATLVGFPWLFAFIGVMFPDEEVFEYLFVVFACLQGLYIGIAFLFTKKTLKLYKDGWNAIFMTRAPPMRLRQLLK